MNLTNTSLCIALTLVSLSPAAETQSTASTTPPDTTSVRTFYLTGVTQVNEGNDLMSAVRNLLPPNVKVNYLSSQQALTVSGTPAELALTQKILSDLDRPRKSYRLTYTTTEIDAGKRVGMQHFAIVVLAGGRTVLKQGSRIPVATGTYAPTSSPSAGTQTQFVYLDVGLNVDASIDESADGVRLRTKVEQSGIAEEKSGLGTQDPIVRQTLIEGTSNLKEGKPVMLGSLDVPDSTRHIDIEVVLELVR